MFGDKPRDIEAANAAGVYGILRDTNAGLPVFDSSLLAR
jgi:phosphoglycolate phosphatase-like HAD superfamily hydrolase